MNVKSISFAGTYNTREIAELVSGKTNANIELLSSMSGVPKDKLYTKYSSDILNVGSKYCAKTIPETRPEFKPLAQISATIKKAFSKLLYQHEDVDIIHGLIDERDNMIDKFCKEHGETVEIPDIDVPVFHI